MKRKLLAVILTLALALAALPVAALAEEGPELPEEEIALLAEEEPAPSEEPEPSEEPAPEPDFVIVDGVLIGYRGSGAAVVIPEGVTAINSSVFTQDTAGDMERVLIPASVTEIRYGAFKSCANLTSVTFLGSNVRIDEYGFMQCGALAEASAPEDFDYHGVYRCPTMRELLFPGFKFYYDDRWVDSKSTYEGPGGRVVIPYGLTAVPYSLLKDREDVTEVVIPDTVRTIYDSAFSGCTGLTWVDIPDSVIMVGSYAFSGCTGLTALDLPGSVSSMGYGAFSGCTGLTRVELPESVTSVGNSAFEDCTGLARISMPGVNTIGDKAFAGCSALKQVDLAQSARGSIGAYAFQNCVSITELVLPEGTYHVRDNAFNGCSALTRLVLPDSLNQLPMSAIEGCTALTHVEGEGKAAQETNWYLDGYEVTINTYGKAVLVKYLGSDRSVVIPEGIHEISSTAFNNNKDMVEVTIPASAESVRRGAFDGCSSLITVTFLKGTTWCDAGAIPNGVDVVYTGAYADFTFSNGSLAKYVGHGGDVVIPDGVTRIGDNAFSGAKYVTSVTIPDSMVSIGNCAFKDCTGLTDLTLPDSVTSIGNQLFAGCTGLVSVKLGNGLTSLGGSAFSGCTGLTSVTIPDGVTEIPATCFSGCTKLRQVTLGSGVRAIGGGAFGGCTALTEFPFPAAIAKIGANAFEGCTGLTSVNIPDTVTELGASAFSRCSGLKTVTVGKGVKTMGNGVFQNCTALTSVTLKNGMAVLGDKCFSGCNGLTNITVPGSVRGVGDQAFENCTALTSVVLEDGVMTLGKGAFSGCSALTSITIPDSVTVFGDNVFQGCLKLTEIVASQKTKDTLKTYLAGQGFEVSQNGVLTKYTGLGGDVTIPDNVTAIGREAFANCGYVTSVTIPSGVTSIGPDAFKNCTGLTSVTILGAAAEVDYTAFSGCDITAVNCPDSLRNVVLGFHIGQDGWLAKYVGAASRVTVPAGVRGIWPGAFTDLENLTWVTLSNTVMTVGSGAFLRCDNLTDVVFPASVTSIALDAVSTGRPENEMSHGASWPAEKVTVHGAAGSYAEYWAGIVYSGTSFDGYSRNKPVYPFVADQPWSVSADAAQHHFIVEYGRLVRYQGPGGEVVVPGNLGITKVIHPVGLENVTSLVLPAGVEEVRISEDTPETCRLRSLTVGEGATSVYTTHPTLEEMVLPDSVTILNLSCKALKECRTPRYVRELWVSCPNLRELFVPKTVTEANIFHRNSPRKLVFEEGSSLYRGKSFTGYFMDLNCGRLDAIVNNPSRTWANHMAPNEAIRDSWADPYGDIKPQTPKVTKLSNEICKGLTTDWDKARAISQWIVNNIEYDDDYYYFGLKSYADVPFNPDEVLDAGMAVCAGYSRLTQAMLAVQNIPCLYITGWTPYGYHAWNLALVDGEYIWMDNTWGMSYFGLGAATISLEHIASGAAVFDNGGVLTAMEPELTEDVQAELDAEMQIAVQSVPVISDWAQEEVEAAQSAGLVPVDLRNSYQDAITRLDFCRVMVKLVEKATGQKVGDYIAQRDLAMVDPFTDTDHSDVLAAYALGIVKGTSETTFNPYGSITRMEAATMLTRTAKVLGLSAGGGEAFADADQFPEWAQEGIVFISGVADPQSGRVVMQGTGGGYFSPAVTYSREQSFMTALRLFHAAG